MAENHSHYNFFGRLGKSMSFRLSRIFRKQNVSDDAVTFCLAHFNASEFLAITLHAIRRYYPKSRVIVADAGSSWDQLCATQSVCRKFSAELHPLLVRHRHTGLLNYLFRQIRTDAGVFLDQDCVLLKSLDPLLEKIAAGFLLVGPNDEIWLTHPNAGIKYPSLLNGRMRTYPQFIHASLMAVNIAQLKKWVGHQPFQWDPAWGQHPLERYYGFTERIRRKSPEAIFPLKSEHTAYGLGTVYLYDEAPLAYHNWFSGQVYGKTEKMEGLLDPNWLRSEMSRFIQDYWNGNLKLDL